MEEELSIEQYIQLVGSNPSWLKRLSFTSILVSANLLQTMFTSTLDGLTSKQWLLLTMTSSIKKPLTLSAIGKIMGCSRQNVKQITDILKRKGFVEYCKIEGDKNTVRVIPTSEWEDYCKTHGASNENILNYIYTGFSDQEIQMFFQSICKIVKNIKEVGINFDEVSKGN